MMKLSFKILFFVLISMCVYAFEPPRELLGFKLTNLKKGSDALVEIYQLHGTKFPLKDAFVAEYKHGEQIIIIWASKSNSGDEAKYLFNEMHRKMPNSRVFKNLKKMQINSIDVYYVYGMEMDNYYFLHKDVNYWIATTHKRSNEVVVDLVRRLK